MKAAHAGHAAAVSELLAAGAVVDAGDEVTALREVFAFVVFKTHCFLFVFTHLRTLGFRFVFSDIHLRVPSAVQHNVQQRQGTALLLAATAGHTAVVSVLLSAKADCDAADEASSRKDCRWDRVCVCAMRCMNRIS